MAHIPVPVKSFATQADRDGVPIDELVSIVGSLRERRVHSVSVTSELTSGTAHQIDYTPFTHDQSFRVKIINSSNTETLNVIGNTLLWYARPIAEEGDTLTAGSAYTDTGYTLIGDVGSAVSGRNSANHLLLQFSENIPVGSTIEVWANEYSGGAISERILRLASQPPKELRYIQRRSTRPEPPGASATYDGVTLDGAPHWVEDGANLAGTDTIWLAIATATYNYLANRWIIGPWTVVSNASGVNVQYSLNGNTWHNTRADNDTLRRWRDSNGLWHVEQLDPIAGGWQLLGSKSWGDGLSGSYYPQTFNFASTNMDEWKFLLLEWVWANSNNQTSHIIIPSQAIVLANPSTAFGTGHTRVARFRRGGSGASFDDPAWGGTSGAGTNTVIFQYQLRRSTSNGSKIATQLYFDPVNSSLSGQLKLYRGR